MSPDHVSDPDDLGPDWWLCSACARAWPSLEAARACEATDEETR